MDVSADEISRNIEEMREAIASMSQVLTDDLKRTESAILEAYIRQSAVELLIRELLKANPSALDQTLQTVENSSIYNDYLKQQLKTFLVLFRD